MSDKVYFIRCTRPERFNLIFRIISYDASTKRGVLQGQYAPFEHDLSKEHLKAAVVACVADKIGERC